MIWLTLVLALLGWPAQQQQSKQHKPQRECDPSITQGMSNGYNQYYCSPEGKWVISQEATKYMADEAVHRHELWAAMRTRVLTEKEMNEVMAYDYRLLVENMQPYFEEEVEKRFNEGLRQQYRLRADAQSATSGTTVMNGTACCHQSAPAPFDVPAVQEVFQREEQGGIGDCISKAGGCFAYDEHSGEPIADILHDANWRTRVYKFWTCVDKSRVLLQSEEGLRHCYKFGGFGEEKEAR